MIPWVLLAFSLSALAQDQTPAPPAEQFFALPPFDCGLVTRYSSHAIGPGCVQEALNVTWDRDYGVARRLGRAKFNTTAITTAKSIRRLYPFNAPDGSTYIVAISSDKAYYAGTDGSLGTVPGFTGMSISENTNCVAALAKFWCTNRVDGLIWWDGTSTGAVAGEPLAGLIDTFRNRIVLGDVVGARSQVYLSGYLDGTDWVLGVKSTSAIAFPLGGANDGDRGRCLMGVYGDAYQFGKEHSLWGLYGFDAKDFQVRELSREVGCIEPKSVQDYDGALTWMSLRGVEQRKGTSVDWKVSEPIYDVLETIVKARGNSRLVVDTSAADFNAGTLTASGAGARMSTTISPGNVVPSSHTALDDSGPYELNLTSYSAVYLSTVSVGLYMCTIAGDEPSCFTSANFVMSGAVQIAQVSVATSPVFAMSYSTPLAAAELDVYCNSEMCFFDDPLGASSVLYSSATLWMSTNGATGPFSYSADLGGASHEFSATGATYTFVLTGNNSAVPSAVTHAKLEVDLRCNVGDPCYTDFVISGVRLIESTTGYAISQCHAMGDISSFGLFQCNYVTTGNATVTFAVSTGATCNSVIQSTATWNTQVNNTLFATSTAAYVAYRPYFGPTSSTETSKLQDCTINWNEGAARPEVASAVYDHKYHLFYTTSTDTGAGNSDVLVLDEKGRWSQWDSVPAMSATVFNRELIVGDYSDTGQLYRLYTGYDDDGAAFTSRIRTADYDLGNWVVTKELKQVYLELEPALDLAAVPTLTLTAYINKDTTVALSTVALNEDTGIIRARAPFAASGLTTGRYVSLQISNTGRNDWKLYRGLLRYRVLRED